MVVREAGGRGGEGKRREVGRRVKEEEGRRGRGGRERRVERRRQGERGTRGSKRQGGRGKSD